MSSGKSFNVKLLSPIIGVYLLSAVSTVCAYGEKHVEATYKYDSVVNGFTQQAGIEPLDSEISAEEVEKRPYRSYVEAPKQLVLIIGDFCYDVSKGGIANGR